MEMLQQVFNTVNWLGCHDLFYSSPRSQDLILNTVGFFVFVFFLTSSLRQYIFCTCITALVDGGLKWQNLDFMRPCHMKTSLVLYSLCCVLSSHKDSSKSWHICLFQTRQRILLIIVIKVSQNPFQPANQYHGLPLQAHCLLFLLFPGALSLKSTWFFTFILLHYTDPDPEQHLAYVFFIIRVLFFKCCLSVIWWMWAHSWQEKSFPSKYASDVKNAVSAL